MLDFVGVLSENVKKSSECVLPDENSTPNDQQAVLDTVDRRLEKIEQNLNSSTLICRGPAVEDLLKQTPSHDSANLERLKGEVCKTVCGEEVTGIDVGNLRLSIDGRGKKCIRLNCNNPASKLHLLRQARERRPRGFFLNEFLTANKLKIFYNLHQLKKQHPEKIKAAFTREGNVLYMLHSSNKVYQVSSLGDLADIIQVILLTTVLEWWCRMLVVQ